MVYDKAKWHSGGEFPKELPYENGGTHIGIFLAWAINHGMASAELVADAGMDLDALRQRRATGRSILFRHLDGVLSDEDLSDEGNLFAKHYYQKYQAEYEALVRKRSLLGRGLKTAYHATDDWLTYDKVAAMIDRAYSNFQRSNDGAKGV